MVCLAYNHERFIRDAISSVIDQRVDFDVQLIVADDCSTDGTLAIAKEFAERLPGRITLIARSVNVGPYENFVQALDAADGEYVAICEGDDYWTDPGKLATQVALMDATPELSLCFHRVRIVTVDADEEDYVWPSRTFLVAPSLDELLQENFIPTLSVMYRNCGLSRAELPDVSPLDWFVHIARAREGRIGFVEGEMGVYRRHSQGLWWASDHDPPAFWRHHAAGQAAFCESLAKLFADDPDRLALVGVHAARVFGGIAAHLPGEVQARYLELATAYPATAGLAVQDLLCTLDRSRTHVQELESALARSEDVRVRESEIAEASMAKLQRRGKRSERRLERLTLREAELAAALAEARRELSRGRGQRLKRRLRRLLDRS